MIASYLGQGFCSWRDEAAAGLVHDQVGACDGCAGGLDLHAAAHVAWGVINSDFIMPGACGIDTGTRQISIYRIQSLHHDPSSHSTP